MSIRACHRLSIRLDLPVAHNVLCFLPSNDFIILSLAPQTCYAYSYDLYQRESKLLFRVKLPICSNCSHTSTSHNEAAHARLRKVIWNHVAWIKELKAKFATDDPFGAITGNWLVLASFDFFRPQATRTSELRTDISISRKRSSTARMPSGYAPEQFQQQERTFYPSTRQQEKSP